jgi:hypothetical protein
LSSRIDVAEKAPAFESRSARLRVDAYPAHSGKINYQAMVARAESSEAMAAATNRCKYSRSCRGSYNALHVREICATRY